MHHVAEHAANALEMGLHAVMTPPFWLALAAWSLAWFLYSSGRNCRLSLRGALGPLRAPAARTSTTSTGSTRTSSRAPRRGLGSLLWNAGDRAIIDGALVNGSANAVGCLAGIVRRVQTGFLYTYAFWMVIGLALLLGWFLVGAR